MITRADFQKLADMRLREAKILLDAGEYDGAYYLAGYAVECALKSCIIRRKLTLPESWPDKKFTDRCHTHDLKDLLKIAELEDDLKAAKLVEDRWGLVKDWTEQSRYVIGKIERDVRQVYEAISHPTEGVLQWLKIRW